MLESLGYAAGAGALGRRPDPVQHLLDPRERRQPLHRPPRRGQAAQVRGPGAGRRRRGLLGAVGQGRGLRALPVRRRRLRPGPDRAPGRVPGLGLDHRAGLLRVRGLRRPSADEARARVPGLAADLPGLQLRLLVLHRALDPRARAEPRPGGARRRGRGARRRRGPRGHPAGPEREQLRPRPGAATDDVRRAAGDDRRGRRDRAHPLHQPAPQGHARGRDPRPRRAAGAVRAHPPAAAVGVDPDPEGDAAHLQPRALPRPGGADPRARARLRADHRHHRRLPG